MNEELKYVPGSCNIGPAELKARKQFAIRAGILTLGLTIVFLVTGINSYWRLLLFIPITSSSVGYLQWYYHFCVNFGLRGVFNFGDLGKTFSVEQQEFYKKDRAKAIKIITVSITIGLITSILIFLIPQ